MVPGGGLQGREAGDASYISCERRPRIYDNWRPSALSPEVSGYIWCQFMLLSTALPPQLGTLRGAAHSFAVSAALHRRSQRTGACQVRQHMAAACDRCLLHRDMRQVRSPLMAPPSSNQFRDQPGTLGEMYLLC